MQKNNDEFEIRQSEALNKMKEEFDIKIKEFEKQLQHNMYKIPIEMLLVEILNWASTSANISEKLSDRTLNKPSNITTKTMRSV